MTNDVMHDDIQLIAEAQVGNTDAFEQLVAKYQKKIFGIAFHMVFDRDEADDITQSVLITLWKSMKQIKDIKKFKTWLYRTTVNKSIDAIRRKKREKTYDLELVKSHSEQDTRMITQFDLEKIYKTVAKALPEQQRAVFMLKDIYQMEIQEVAEILDISESTVRSHLSLARLNLQKEIQKQYPEYNLL
jgi:RNA polymerase sigma-70 factor, ECF subfamily